MSFNAKDQAGGSGVQQPVIPVANYPARLVQLIDLGLQSQNPYKGTEKPPIHMLRTTYELVTEFCVDENGEPDVERPRWIGEEFPFYNLSAEKAKSTQRYLALDPSQAADGDWSKLIGDACTLTVVHNKAKNGNTYANIGSTSPPMKGYEVPALTNEPLVWSLDDPDIEAFNKFPEFLQDKIKSNLNYKGSKLEALLEGKDYEGQDQAAAEGGEAAKENPYG